MKKLIIIVCMLSVTVAVYGLNKQRARKFQENLTICTKELSGKKSFISAPDALLPDIIICVLQKDGRIFYENGQIIKYEMWTLITDCIPIQKDILWALQLFKECYRDGIQSEGTGNEQTKKIIKCIIQIVFLFETEQVQIADSVRDII